LGQPLADVEGAVVAVTSRADWYYDREGKPISQKEWTRLMGVEDYKIVAQHQVGDSWVSTVWLGINHNFGSTGPAIIFETMVFGGRLADEMCRYATEAQAVEGHAVMVGRVRAIQGEPVEVVARRLDTRMDPP
jgi:hypothetical protein